MRCFKVRRKLPVLLAKQLNSHKSEQIQAHLRTCSGCQQELTALKQLDELMSVYPSLKISENFEQKFWAKVRESVSRGRTFAPFYRWVLATLILSLMAGAGSGIYSAKYNAKKQFMAEAKIDYLRDYPPNSLSGKNMVLVSLK